MSVRARPLVLLPLALALNACDWRKECCVGPGGEELPSGVELLMSDKSREMSPDATPEELAELVTGDTAFAFEMYQQLRAAEQGDLFFSPFSISVALGMTWAGSKATTESQIADTLDFTLTQDRLHPAMNALDLALDGRAAEAIDASEPFTLNVLNSIWGQVGYDWQADWLDTLAVNYGAGIYLLDITGDPEGARGLINEAISDATETMIPELLPSGSITADTVLVLTNAILFQASWDTPFEEDATSTGDFHRADGSAVEVPLMQAELSARYASGEGYQAVELPYDGEMFSMVILVPDEGDFEGFDAALTGETFARIWDDLDDARVDLTLPRWSTDQGVSLATTLQAMGMEDAFDPTRADFTGILSTGTLYVDDVIHQAVITVDEKGTKAAAATAVIISDTGSIPEDPIVVRADRPFVYAIVDRQTGTVLFLGRLVDPS